MPKVWNKKTDKNIPTAAVYCGRPSKWGNPFTIGKDGSREDVIIKYRNWISHQEDIWSEAREELRGKDLICWCAPLPCHCHVLMEIAND